MAKKLITKETASAMGKKGGKAKKGTVSIKAAMKRALNEGIVNVDDLAQAFLLHAKEGNGAYAKIALEYIDGKVKDELEVKQIVKTPLAQAIEDIKKKK